MSPPSTPTVPYQAVAWRTDLAPVPEHISSIPLPGTLAFQSVKGREGDLLVIQVRSGEHAGNVRKQALSDLQLGKINAASIQKSAPEVIGRIHLLRGYLAVADLNGVKFKEQVELDEKTGLEYETIPFGSNTRPGELVRDSSGNYFVFESDRNGVLVNWSTNVTVDESIVRLRELYPNGRLSSEPDASVVGLEEPVPTLDRFNDDVNILSLSGPDALKIVESDARFIAFARIAFTDLQFTWHQPYERFDDRQSVRAELGLYFRSLEYLPLASQYARHTGDSGFFKASDLHIVKRERGIVRELPF